MDGRLVTAVECNTRLYDANDGLRTLEGWARRSPRRYCGALVK